jgi:hypothetical protein
MGGGANGTPDTACQPELDMYAARLRGCAATARQPSPDTRAKAGAKGGTRTPTILGSYPMHFVASCLFPLSVLL